MTVDTQKQQGHQHGQELADHRDVNTVGRVDHGSERHPHLDRDDLPGNHEYLKKQLQRQAEQRTDDDLLCNQQQRTKVQRLDFRHRRQTRHNYHCDRQGEIQANACRHQGGAEHRHGHQYRRHTK
ncbi:hypothetical protein D3C72_2087830 [compost metagenome]